MKTDPIPARTYGQLAAKIIEGGAKRATKYLSPRQIVRATLVGKRDKRSASLTIVFTIGRPNYSEREFIKAAKRAGEPFPIKDIQLKFEGLH